jgi:pantoate--beta-alanine ligase
MGALHAGHLALLEAARARCGSVIASLFVNPTQFNDPADFQGYPRDEAADLAMLEAAGCDAVWLPPVAAMYGPHETTMVDPGEPAAAWEGAARPGHFRGMATVVTKLLTLLRPDLAFFGEKDWQQLQIVRRLAADLCLGAEIVGVATVREPDGLAMSSRNRLLDPAERATASRFPACLAALAAALRRGAAVDRTLREGRAALTQAGLVPDYLALVDGPSLRPVALVPGARLIAAVRLGRIRLLDNLPV